MAKKEIYLIPRATHPKSRHMCEEGLGALRVVQPAVADGTARRADGESAAVELSARAVASLRCFVYYLEV